MNIFNAWINGLSQGKPLSSQFHPISNFGGKIVQLNHSNSVIDNTTELMPIELEDTEDQIVYWKSVVVIYILGANPPHNVMEGFIHRI